MFYQIMEEGETGPDVAEEDNSYADTMNQIFLPVVLIFAYITVIFTADIFKTHSQIREIMGAWDQSQIARIVVELQRQEIIKAFEEVRREQKDSLGLTILESGNFRFDIPLDSNRVIKSVNIERLENGGYRTIDLRLYKQRLIAKMGSEESKAEQGIDLYRRVLDRAGLKDADGRDPGATGTRTAIQPRNAEYLKSELIAPYLTSSERVIIDFQLQLLEEISLHFNRQLDQWAQWDAPSYRLFQEAMEVNQAGRIEEAKARFAMVQGAMFGKLRTDIEPHYVIFQGAWDKLGVKHR